VHQKVVAITIRGKVLDSSTKKPISETLYPNLMIYANGATKSVKIDPKTGEYILDLLVNENTKNIIIYISSDDNRYSKEFPINTKEKSKTLNILVNSKEDFQSTKILGGMGVNYIDDKKNILS
jgi:hypothetical protein